MNQLENFVIPNNFALNFIFLMGSLFFFFRFPFYLLEHRNERKSNLIKERKEWFYKLIDLLKERSHRIKDFPLRAKPFLSDDFSYDREGIEKYLKDERLKELLSKLKEDFLQMEDFTASNIECVLRQRAEREGIKAALLIHAVRMLVVGTPVSPGIFDVLELIGEEKTIQRISGSSPKKLKNNIRDI